MIRKIFGIIKALTDRTREYEHRMAVIPSETSSSDGLRVDPRPGSVQDNSQRNNWLMLKVSNGCFLGDHIDGAWPTGHSAITVVGRVDGGTASLAAPKGAANESGRCFRRSRDPNRIAGFPEMSDARADRFGRPSCQNSNAPLRGRRCLDASTTSVEHSNCGLSGQFRIAAVPPKMGRRLK